MNRRTFGLSLALVLCCSLIAPSLVRISFAQDPNVLLIQRLQNRPKLLLETSRFDQAISKLRPLATKTTFTAQDRVILDAFINETDDGEPIAVRAQSKAFAAALRVQTFEASVKAAARGKDPSAFIASLEENPESVYQLPGAREAAKAFTDSVKGDAALLLTIGEHLEAASKKSPAGHHAQMSRPNAASFERGTDREPNNKLGLTGSPVIKEPATALVAIPGAIEAMLITMAAVYLSVQTKRLLTGEIGKCVHRAYKEYRDECIANERADGSGLTTSERDHCRALYYLDVALCVALPI